MQFRNIVGVQALAFYCLNFRLNAYFFGEYKNMEHHDTLGEILTSRGILSEGQLQLALSEQKKSGEFLGQVILRLNLAKEENVLPLLAHHLQLPYVRLQDQHIELSIVARVPAKFVCHYQMIPLSLDNGHLNIALANPLDIQILDDIRLVLDYEVKPVLASEEEIRKAIKRYYGVGAETIEGMEVQRNKTVDVMNAETGTEDIENLAMDASVIKLVNQVLLEAINENATDIHFEPYEDELRIRYRVDGLLYETSMPSGIGHFQQAIASRIKVMANLNIAEHRLPQDGKIRIRVGESVYDLRISILPVSFGETVNIRILSRRAYTMEELGLGKDNIERLNELIKKPSGIILVTGPTGSGKTTTLYACLSRINSLEKKIITIEDPIEYQIKGVTQMQVSPMIGFTFANALRSMLRHDPDIMMIGEIRDLETAELAIRTALTGHLVFSTLHTNDAAGAITRLLDMGIEPFLLSSSIDVIIAQRLVRKLCPVCKSKTGEAAPLSCEVCRFTGYKGRTGIYEILIVNDEIRRLIMDKSPTYKIKEKAVSFGMNSLLEDGYQKAACGITTESEVMRVVQL
ncbi:GspE/PulE family protein [bacterium]|nr:GspE/PulE family protein [bacterium]